MTDWWPRCRDWILPALAREDEDEAELVGDLAAGRAQLWPGEGAAMVTQCVDEPQGRCLHVWLAGGALAEILRLRPGVEAWARAQGCGRVTLNGRGGWARALRGHGYARRGEELERRL